MKELLQISRFIWIEKKDALKSVIFGFIAGITAVGLFAANGYLISKAALQPPMYVLIFMVGIVKFGSILRAVSRYAERYYSHRATFTMLSHLRTYFYEKLEPLAPQLFQRYRSGDILAIIVGDIESLQNLFLRVIYPPIIMITVFLFTILFVSFYSIPIMFLLLIGLILTGFVIPAWFVIIQRRLNSKTRELRAYLSTEVTEWIYGFRELKLHQQLDNKEEQMITAADNYVHEQERMGMGSVFSQSINMTVSLVISWVILGLGAYFTSIGEMDGLFLAMLVMIALTVFEHSTPMAAFSIHYDESQQAASRLYSVVSEEQTNRKSMNKSFQYSKKAPTIEFDNVKFSYLNDQRMSLNHISFNLPAGSKTAIVGPSGSGKSTLLLLLLKLCLVSEGAIRMDGMPLSEHDQEQIWKRTNVILQENHFFFGTIRDNLLLSSDTWSDCQLQQLLSDVQLSHYSLNDHVMEKGQNLSGGERQRLAMARAIVKGSSLWLLDEPASALDASTERKLFNLLYKHAKEDTIILISHRLEGLEFMDQIIVLDEGCIIESGNYEELMNLKGYFYKLKQIEKNVLLM
jgi:ATP-binding cassette subfamily C protein CydC